MGRRRIEASLALNIISNGLPGERPQGTRTEGEFLTQKGAMALARRLETYWHDKGFPAARFWAEPIGERFEKVGTYDIYRVTSNLINGMPPRYMPGFNVTSLNGAASRH
jgi:hypothetical protein